MDALVESIKEQGILSPLIVRPSEAGEYEVISGHRRLHAAEKAGLTEVPALIYPLSREEAAIAVVDSNLHREHILPSEKAFAYKLKMEALSQQGKHALSQVATKTDTAAQIGKDTGESRDQVFRYIRLTKLIPEILEKVDEDKIALTPAVELSYLSAREQQDLLETMESEDCTPSLSQAQRMKKASQKGELSADVIFTILSEPKANQQEKISFKVDELRSFFPKDYTPKDIYNAILQMILEQMRSREKQERRSRKRGSREEL
jgi:ParB family chromosome partitioning protein